MSDVDKIYIYQKEGSDGSQGIWQLTIYVNNSKHSVERTIELLPFADFNKYVEESAQVLARARKHPPPVPEHRDLVRWNDKVTQYAQTLLDQLQFDDLKAHQPKLFLDRSERCIVYVVEEHKNKLPKGRGPHSIKWELLEGLALGKAFANPYKIAISRVIDFLNRPRRSHFASLAEMQRHENETIKILLVVARDLTKGEGKKDADPDLTQRPLMELQQTLNHGRTRVLVEIVRPGARQNLWKHLKGREKQGVHFNIIHFDMHGDDKNQNANSESGLKFTDTKNKDPRAVSSEKISDVARIIESFHIEHVVLTACWSAFEGAGRANNMAQHFLHANVRGVSAVWGRAGSDCIRLHNKAFYGALLGANGHDNRDDRCLSFEMAAHAGREALRNDQRRWPGQPYRDDFLYVYYARDNPRRTLEPKIFPTWDISLGRTLLKFRRRRPQALLSSGTIQNFPRFNHLALELEIYLQGNKVVYANDSLERQGNLLRTITGLSELWLQTNFVHRVLFYDTQWPSEGLPTHRIKSREIHGYMRGHRLLEALGGSVHIFQGLDIVFHGYNEEGNQEGRRRDIVVRMRHFLRDMRDSDYAIIVGSCTESQWMPLEWKNNLPGKPAKFWSHGSSIYDEEEDKPDALSNDDHWGNIYVN